MWRTVRIQFDDVQNEVKDLCSRCMYGSNVCDRCKNDAIQFHPSCTACRRTANLPGHIRQNGFSFSRTVLITFLSVVQMLRDKSVEHKTFYLLININSEGARCSSVVREFAHGAMGRRIDPS